MWSARSVRVRLPRCHVRDTPSRTTTTTSSSSRAARLPRTPRGFVAILSACRSVAELARAPGLSSPSDPSPSRSSVRAVRTSHRDSEYNQRLQFTPVVAPFETLSTLNPAPIPTLCRSRPAGHSMIYRFFDDLQTNANCDLSCLLFSPQTSIMVYSIQPRLSFASQLNLLLHIHIHPQTSRERGA